MPMINHPVHVQQRGSRQRSDQRDVMPGPSSCTAPLRFCDEIFTDKWEYFPLVGHPVELSTKHKKYFARWSLVERAYWCCRIKNLLKDSVINKDPSPNIVKYL